MVDEEGEGGIDRREALRAYEDAIFEPPRPVMPLEEVPQGPSPSRVTERPAVPATRLRLWAVSGAALGIAGVGWLAAAMVLKGWLACALAAAFLTAGLIMLGRACAGEKP